MKIKEVEKNGRKFLKLELFPVKQKKQIFYLAKMPALELIRLYTVEPAKYDIPKQLAFAAKFKDDESYYDYLINEDRKRIDEKPFERKESTERIGQIADFLNKQEYALFPNTIIVSCDLINSYLDADADADFLNIKNIETVLDEYPNYSYLEKLNGEVHLYIPSKENTILVIDGQHRIKGLAKSNVKDNYDLLVSFIIDVDKSVLAQLFYTINYTQKPVNKSLLYHLSGEFSYELNEIKFMHEAVKILNEIDTSPFFKRIKMLGTIPHELPPAEKSKVTVSQAFLIDWLLGAITKVKDGKSIYPPIFLYFYRNEKYQIEIIRFLIKFFNAIKQIDSLEWDDPNVSLASKTIGVGALIRVMYFLFVEMFVNEFHNDPSKMKAVTTEAIVNNLKGIQTVDFKKNGSFSEAGGIAGVNILKECIIERVTYFKAKKYAQFIIEYKKNFLEPFRSWLAKHT